MERNVEKEKEITKRFHLCDEPHAFTQALCRLTTGSSHARRECVFSSLMRDGIYIYNIIKEAVNHIIHGKLLEAVPIFTGGYPKILVFFKN